MSPVLTEPHVGTLADLLHELGEIDPARVLLHPRPAQPRRKTCSASPPISNRSPNRSTELWW